MCYMMQTLTSLSLPLQMVHFRANTNLRSLRNLCNNKHRIDNREIAIEKLLIPTIRSRIEISSPFQCLAQNKNCIAFPDQV